MKNQLSTINYQLSIILRVFWHSLAFVSAILTGSVVWFVWRTGETAGLGGMTVAQWIFFAMVLFLFHESGKKRLMYWRNLGVSRKALYIGLFAIDAVTSAAAIFTAGYGFR